MPISRGVIDARPFLASDGRVVCVRNRRCRVREPTCEARRLYEDLRILLKAIFNTDKVVVRDDVPAQDATSIKGLACFGDREVRPVDTNSCCLLVQSKALRSDETTHRSSCFWELSW